MGRAGTSCAGKLELTDERRFADGMVHLRYRVVA
jgi:hypothetical protein